MLKKSGLINTFLAAGLATALFGCKDTTTEYSEPVLTDVKISQQYKPPYTTIEYDVVQSITKPVPHPARYFTTISSSECSQKLEGKKAFDFFKKEQPKRLRYVNIFRNEYGQKGLVYDILKSDKIGCKFIIPSE